MYLICLSSGVARAATERQFTRGEKFRSVSRKFNVSAVTKIVHAAFTSRLYIQQDVAAFYWFK